jgi:hypothetical protein
MLLLIVVTYADCAGCHLLGQATFGQHCQGFMAMRVIAAQPDITATLFVCSRKGKAAWWQFVLQDGLASRCLCIKSGHDIACV